MIMFSLETQCFEMKMFICNTYCIKQQHSKDVNEPRMSINLDVDRSPLSTDCIFLKSIIMQLPNSIHNINLHIVFRNKIHWRKNTTANCKAGNNCVIRGKKRRRIEGSLQCLLEMTEVCWFGTSTGNWKTPTLRKYVESQMSKESRADCAWEPWEAARSSSTELRAPAQPSMQHTALICQSLMQ